MTTGDEPERGFHEPALHDKSWGPRLKELAAALSDGDRSVLLSLLQETKDATAMTSRGSPNDWFWAHLSRIGWMAPREDAVPDPLRATIVAYHVTEEGQTHLPGLLPHFFDTPSRTLN